MSANKYMKDQINSAIPGRIRNLSELAEKAGVNQPNLSEFMNGKRKSMNLETAWKILAVLGLEVRPIGAAQAQPATPKQDYELERLQDKVASLTRENTLLQKLVSKYENDEQLKKEAPQSQDFYTRDATSAPDSNASERSGPGSG